MQISEINAERPPARRVLSLMKPVLAVTLLAALSAGATQPAAAQRRNGEERLARELAGRIAGAPVTCLPLRQTQGSRIIEGTAIVYEIGSTLYVNRPRSGADLLHRDDIMVVRTPEGQLCRSDAVELRDRDLRIHSGFVILDRFVPYTRPRPRR